MIGTKGCDKDTSASIWNHINQEFIRRMELKAKQGVIYRIGQYTSHAMKLIPNEGNTWRLNHGVGNSLSRSIYKDNKYRLRVLNYLDEKRELQTQRETLQDGDQERNTRRKKYQANPEMETKRDIREKTHPTCY
jgi:hypothetical protein